MTFWGTATVLVVLAQLTPSGAGTGAPGRGREGRLFQNVPERTGSAVNIGNPLDAIPEVKPGPPAEGQSPGLTAIGGVRTHADLMTKRNPVYLIPVTEKSWEGILHLRAKFLSLVALHENNAKPKHFVAPRVTGPAGFNRNPVVNKSKEDIARSKRNVNTQAKAAVQHFIKKHHSKAAIPNARGQFVFRDIPEGRYLVCHEATVRNRDKSSGVLSKPAIWLVRTEIRKGDVVRLSFDADSASDWDTLFPETLGKGK